jgi:nicotinate-nucleotide adenylyltransferase
MRVGVFGGTFDPVHLGHLILAEQAREQGRLDQVWFIPAARPPHKDPGTLFRHRAEMLHLAVAGHPAFRVDELEEARPGPSFTVHTLTELSRQHPGNQWFLLIGADTLAELHEWYDPVGVVRQAGLMVMGRPGERILTPEEIRRALHLSEDLSLQLEVIAAPLIDISSHDLRNRAAQGRSLRYFVPRAVEIYAQEKGLYRA